MWLNGPSGYGGLTLWYQDEDNYVEVGLYPAAGGLRVFEFSGGQFYDTTYPTTAYGERTWHLLRAKADSRTGRIRIYVNDTYLATYEAASVNREGLSRLFGGNSGGYFDNYSVRGQAPRVR